MTYRKLALSIALCLPMPLILCGVSCNQNTTAALVGIAGTAIATVETIEGHSDLAATLQKDFGAAQTAVLNWKSGTPTQDVAQALKLVESDLNLLPVSQQDQAYITLAIGTVDSILALFPSASPALARPNLSSVAAPKTEDEFRAQFNALVATHPIKGLKPLK